jgi:hypothetical protein
MRIGPRMKEALTVVEANPGCCKLLVARAIAPRGSGGGLGIQYGYRAVDRAIRAGLIVIGAGSKRRYNAYALWPRNYLLF